jgi:hypothetical protein
MRKYSFFLLIVLLLGSLNLTDTPAPVSLAQDDPGNTCVATHYPELGGCDPAPSAEVRVSYTVYNNRENDPTAITPEEIAALKNLLETENGVSFVFLNDWQDVQAGLDAVQIVNNVPVQGALYTLILPIGWSPDGSYPVVLSGNGAGTSNNRRLYQGNEHFLPDMVARSTSDEHSGFVGVYSNAGGTESLGIDEVTYRSVEAFFHWVAENAGGDPERLVTAGVSRGGGVSLMWAINPLGLDYHVRGVFADIPPTAYGYYTQRSVMTYPALAGINTLVLHNPLAWIYGRKDGPGEPYSRAMEYIISTGDPTEADKLSPIGNVAGLADKDILLGHGTHDVFFQLAVFLRFDRALTEAGISHGSYITLGQGHSATVGMWQEVEKYLTGLQTGEAYALPTGRQIWIDQTPAGNSFNDVPLNEFLTSRGLEPLPDGEIPFTAELPYQTGIGFPMDVSACGGVGAEFKLMWQGPEDSDPQVVLEGVFDETECASVQIPSPDVAGEYVWTFEYRGEAIPNTNTIQRDEDGCATIPATTIVQETQPFLRDNFTFDFSMGWGIDQFVGQADTCMVQ